MKKFFIHEKEARGKFESMLLQHQGFRTTQDFGNFTFALRLRV